MRGNFCFASAAVLVARALGSVTLTPSNITQYDDAGSNPIELALPSSASSMRPVAHILPLFSSGVQDLPAWGLSDALFHATASNSMSITGDTIAYMSCDASAYPGNIGSSAVFNTALAVNATAVLLYSTSSNYCNVTALESSYPYIYTMTNSTTSQILLTSINTALGSFPLHGTINFADRVANNSTSSGNSGQTTSQTSTGSLGASPTTAVAMIILYSITGIITALFLVIIITGAVRAHRHPERYGPRNIIGRPRQSRAKGLARAMLDTIPIVKFGETNEASKPTDVELAEGDHAAPVTTKLYPNTVVEARSSLDGNDQLSPISAHQPRQSMASARSGIAPAAHAADPSTTHNLDDDVPGCSICTEDFERGEDLRVLPCDHRFHPACIDPWLLNVSATCPLCRIDLNPAGSTTENQAGELPPPMDGGEATPRVRIGMRQSFLIGLGLGRVHEHTGEDRLAAVRAMRAQLAATRERDAADREAAAAEPSRRRRFRERFGIRTQRTGQEEEIRETNDTEPDAIAGAERH